MTIMGEQNNTIRELSKNIRTRLQWAAFAWFA